MAPHPTVHLAVFHFTTHLFIYSILENVREQENHVCMSSEYLLIMMSEYPHCNSAFSSLAHKSES